MAPEQHEISRALSDVFTGLYRKKRLTQDVFAERAEMSIVTLQKKLAAKAPITATDLVLMSAALGVEAKDVLEEAMTDIASRTSDAPISLDAHRAKKPAEMNDEEIDRLEGAANHDPENESDQPEEI